MQRTTRSVVTLIAILLASSLLYAETPHPATVTVERAQQLAGLYMYRFISLCGEAQTPILRRGYWDVPIVTGQAAQPAGSIRVDSRTGSVSYPGQPTVTPKQLEEESNSGDKTRRKP